MWLVPESPDDLIVAFQAEKIVGIGHRVMYDLVRSGEIPTVRRSGRWWIRRADLDAALERARVRPGQLSRGTVPRRKGD